MHPHDLMKPDLFREIVLLGSGGVLLASTAAPDRSDCAYASVTADSVFSGGSMPPNVQVGTILIERQSQMAQVLGLESEPCSGNWHLLKALDVFALDRKSREAGWNFFFMAAEVKVMFFGALGAKKIHNAIKRILGKVGQQHFNALEVTGIVAKRFLGVPYAIVSAHSRHIQQSCYLDSTEARRTSERDAEWARG